MEKLYDVLWIEDEADKCSEFIKLCEEEGIKLHISSTREEGIKEFEKDKSRWDAVILDVKCPFKEKSNPDTDGFFEVFRTIGKSVPIFIYTGQPDRIGDSEFAKMCGEISIYKKGEGMDSLIDAILSISTEKAKIRRKYKQVFEAIERHFGKYIEEVEKILVEILTPLHFEDSNQGFQASSYFINLRKLLEYIFRVYNKYGLLPDECIPNGVVNQTYCSLYLAKVNVKLDSIQLLCKERIVPEYMSYNIRSIIEVGNGGAHTSDKNTFYEVGCPKSVLYGSALHLCDIIVWLDCYIGKHSNIEENLSMCKRMSISPQK